MRFPPPLRFAFAAALSLFTLAASAQEAAAPIDETPPPPPAAARVKLAAKWTGPIATYPGFRMLQDGRSRVVVDIRGKIEVSEHRGEGLLTYRLSGVAAPSRINRLPLVTSFFPTPVSRVQLVDRKGDLDLVIELKQPAIPTFRVIPTRTGLQLQIEFPKPGDATAAPPPERNADEPQAE